MSDISSNKPTDNGWIYIDYPRISMSHMHVWEVDKCFVLFYSNVEFYFLSNNITTILLQLVVCVREETLEVLKL